MSRKRRKQIILYWPVELIFFIVLLDQITKLWVDSLFLPGEGFSVIGEHLKIRLVMNTGAAFGLFRDFPFILAGVTVIAILALVFFLFFSYQKLIFSEKLGITLILAGATGNLIDRFRLGAVIDFIDVGFWPVFNVADSSITIGAIFLGVFWYKKLFQKKEREN